MQNSKQLVVFTLGLIFGTGSSITAKSLFDLSVDGKNFAKPLFQTFMMFLGMFLALPLHFWVNRNSESRPKSRGDSLLTPLQARRSYAGSQQFDYQALNEQQNLKERPFKLTTKISLFLAIPSIFDLIATALANMGLVLINVSVYQLLKCTVIVFVAFVKRVVLREKYESYMWIGVFINMIAVCIVAFAGTTAEASSESEKQQQFMGVVLVLLSCLVQSFQYVYEEMVMSSSSSNSQMSDLDNIPPMIVVGMEGFWGLLINGLIVLPVAAYLPGSDCPAMASFNSTGSSSSSSSECSMENTYDTLGMLRDSSAILVLTILYVVIITGYNVFSVYVTYYLDAVWHAILDNFRPVSVWLTQLALFQLTRGLLGEVWTVHSWYQLCGLVLLLCGTAVYNGNLRLPWLRYAAARGPRVDRLHSTALSTSPFLSRGSIAMHAYEDLEEQEEEEMDQHLESDSE